jgi:hypothetical protein
MVQNLHHVTNEIVYLYDYTFCVIVRAGKNGNGFSHSYVVLPCFKNHTLSYFVCCLVN